MLSQPLHLMNTLNSYTEIHTSCNVVTASTFNDYSEFVMLSQPLHLMITLNSYTEIHTSCNVVTTPTFNDYSEFLYRNTYQL